LNKKERIIITMSKTKKIISIDGELQVKTAEQKKRDTLITLNESCKSGKILTGTISGVEKLGKKGPSIAVIYMNDYKIMIPASECIDIPNPGDKDPQMYEQYLLSKRLASEIDFVVKVIEEDNEIAVASRMEAMLKKRKEFLLETDKEGNYIVNEGSIVEARIVCTTRAGIIVEIFGAECYIPCRELSYQRIQDATQDFFVGTRILVKILSIDRDEENSVVKIDASVKQANENPYDKALKFYNEGDKYVGTVSMTDENGVFVSLSGGIDVLCKYPDRGPRLPRGAVVTVRITVKNEEEKRLFGLITHNARF
jgi:ribosomal protein S1